MLDAYECVKSGMAFLDDHMPGWKSSIDLEMLNLQRPTCCVLGQVSALVASGSVHDYPSMQFYLGLKHQDCVELGFFIDFEGSEDEGEKSDLLFAELTMSWKEALEV